jgi:hypothetical protein
MFGWKLVKDRPNTPAEIKLEQIVGILFPPLVTQTNENGDKYQVDYSADSNLEAALIDLEDGSNDRVTQKTILTVANNLFEVRKMLEAYAEIDPEAKFFIVDDGVDDPIDEINNKEGLI